MQLVLASNNTVKTQEIASMFAEYQVDVINYRELLAEQVFPKETTTDLHQNAKTKALFIHRLLPDAYILADDSGLFLDAFPDQFGVTTSRDFKALGIKGTENENAYIAQLYDNPAIDNSAHMTAIYVLVKPDGQVLESSGQSGIHMLNHQLGDYAAGLDRLLVTENGLTLAQMPIAQRVAYHHRGRAAKNLLKQLSF